MDTRCNSENITVSSLCFEHCTFVHVVWVCTLQVLPIVAQLVMLFITSEGSVAVVVLWNSYFVKKKKKQKKKRVIFIYLGSNPNCVNPVGWSKNEASIEEREEKKKRWRSLDLHLEARQFERWKKRLEKKKHEKLATSDGRDSLRGDALKKIHVVRAATL